MHGFAVFPDVMPCVPQYAKRCMDAIGEWLETAVEGRDERGV